jgi:protein required for attachment to host cells
MTEVRIPNNALVVVADSAKALFLRNKGTPVDVNLQTEDVLTQDNPPTREQGASQPGRGHSPGGVNRGAMAETDLQALGEQRFAGEIAQRLYKAVNSNGYDKLVLVAGPDLLGMLRRELHQEVARRLVGEVPKTLTGHDVGAIEKVLAAS